MRQESSTDTPIIKRDLRRLITDIPETSFLPPSFPPQLATSTPVLQPESARQKPPPILLNSSPPLFLPQSPSMFNPQINEDSSSSQPPPMSSPSTRLTSFLPNRNGKRPQVSVADQSPKRARIEAQSIPPADTCAPPNPTPLLVEVPDTVVPVTPKSKRLPTLTELLASSERSTKLGKRKPSPKLIFRELARRTSPGQPFHDVDPAIHGAQPAELETGESQQAHDEILSVPFEPMFTSTQQQRSQDPAPSGKIAGISRTDSMGWLGYNSQFDVDGQVDEVTRFMEKDVDCDQWLNVDPSPDG
ncbi:hypothetical protein BD779DRAFT_303260 [Infundibulicybe gibba]|nr:hypothetical protein BD779DRAFT_303260 [Infundibulicybe gibba]